jgi:hypothetical protein
MKNGGSFMYTEALKIHRYDLTVSALPRTGVL